MKTNKILICISVCLIIQAGCEREIMQVQTGNVSKIQSTTVYISGYLNSAGEGIKKYGHCLSVNPGPTLSGIKTEFCSTIGTGEFTSVLYNLEPETKYYARAYITLGIDVVYGSEISFTTAGSIQHDPASGLKLAEQEKKKR